MMLTEFEIIKRFFTRRRSPSPLAAHPDIGDDCALLTPSFGHQLAVSTDMLVAGHHFFAEVDPRSLGHKALAVNLSDLAAMGAEPRAFMLALALREPSEAWLQPFSDGLFALAERYHCPLIGGDTCAGPLNLCITIFGQVKAGGALTRDAACVGDDIWVSGTLGDARLALGVLRDQWRVDTKHWPGVRRALEWPEPRIALGLALRGIAHAAIDLSDGLAGDLAHILARSNVAATVAVDKLPRSAALRQQPLPIQQHCAIAGGDDYELCFTAAKNQREAILRLSQTLQIALTCIGQITAASSDADRIVWQNAAHPSLDITFDGYDQFRGN